MSEWTDIGEQLRKARESKGLDLKDVAHTTRIPLATLAALEESDYSIFPSPTYARSFLAQYSEYLNVDAHEWIDAFETGDVLSNVNDHGYLQSHNEHIGDHRHESESPRRGNRSHSSRNSDSSSAKNSGGGSSILQTFTVFFVTAMLIAGGIYAYKKFEPMLKGALSEEKDQTSDDDQDQDTGTGSGIASDPSSQGSEPTKNTPEQKSPVVVKNAPPATGEGSTTSGQTTKPSSPANPVITPNRTGKPPKAMVIDEDEE